MSGTISILIHFFFMFQKKFRIHSTTLLDYLYKFNVSTDCQITGWTCIIWNLHVCHFWVDFSIQIYSNAVPSSLWLEMTILEFHSVLHLEAFKLLVFQTHLKIEESKKNGCVFGGNHSKNSVKAIIDWTEKKIQKKSSKVKKIMKGYHNKISAQNSILDLLLNPRLRKDKYKRI